MAAGIRNLNELLDRAKKREKSKLVVAASEDKAVLLAIQEAVKEGIVAPVLIGNAAKVESIMKEIGFPTNGVELVQSDSPEESAIAAVKIIHTGQGDILMKGQIATAPLLKAALDKEFGLKHTGILSHFALFQISKYHKLLGITDAGMNIAPDFEEKVDILNNATAVMRRLGVMLPKVAVLCPVETVNPKIESTVHAAMLTLMNKRNQIRECIVDGPLALDIAVSLEAAKHKGIDSPVAGDPDIILTPNLDTGNALYKSINFLAGGLVAAFITGASVPIVLTSRSDSEHSKFMSIVLAAALE